MTITPDKSALAQARERLEKLCNELSFLENVKQRHADLRLVLDALAEAERKLAGWPSVECPCCGEEAAMAMFFEDGQPTICGCGGFVTADGNVSIRIDCCENEKCKDSQ